jgi:transitional endoplasmic reticulum ATPase
MDVNDVTLGTIARLTWVSDDGQHATIQLADGRTGSVDFLQGISFPVDAVIQVPADGSSAFRLPDDAVPPMSFIGVVRKRQGGVTVVESEGKMQRIPESAVEYAERNTVEFRPATGVIRVIDERPLRTTFTETVRDEPNADQYLREPDPRLSFDSFAGLEHVKKRARELIEVPLNYHNELEEIGARPITGVLFTGQPGTGKTFLARIIAQEARAAFYAISGPEIVSKWVGDSEDVLRTVFDAAKEQERAIVFFDEVDSVAARRGEDSHEASKRLVAQLLTLMDGFEDHDNVVVIAATNRPDDIDPALRRPGRFDWEIEFPAPNQDSRQRILQTTAAKLKTEGPLPYEEVAALTEQWSPADLAAIWSDAALLAVVDGRRRIMAEDCWAAYERVAARRVSRAEKGVDAS